MQFFGVRTFVAGHTVFKYNLRDLYTNKIHAIHSEIFELNVFAMFEYHIKLLAQLPNLS